MADFPSLEGNWWIPSPSILYLQVEKINHFLPSAFVWSLLANGQRPFDIVYKLFISTAAPGRTRTPRGWRQNIWLNNRKLSSTVMLLCWCFIGSLGWRDVHWHTGWVILVIYCKAWRMVLGGIWQQTNTCLIYKERPTTALWYIGSGLLVAAHYADIILHCPGDTRRDFSELKFDVLWNRKNKNK